MINYQENQEINQTISIIDLWKRIQFRPSVKEYKELARYSEIPLWKPYLWILFLGSIGTLLASTIVIFSSIELNDIFERFHIEVLIRFFSASFGFGLLMCFVVWLSSTSANIFAYGGPIINLWQNDLIKLSAFYYPTLFFFINLLPIWFHPITSLILGLIYLIPFNSIAIKAVYDLSWAKSFLRALINSTIQVISVPFQIFFILSILDLIRA